MPVIKLGMDVWKRVENELHSRRQTNAWFGRKLGASRQVVAGWKKRGVPAIHYQRIAALFEWTLDRLVSGIEDSTPEKAEAAPTTAPLPAEAIYSPLALEIARMIDKIGDMDQKRRAYTLILQITALDSAPSPTVPAPSQPAPAALRLRA